MTLLPIRFPMIILITYSIIEYGFGYWYNYSFAYWIPIQLLTTNLVTKDWFNYQIPITLQIPISVINCKIEYQLINYWFIHWLPNKIPINRLLIKIPIWLPISHLIQNMDFAIPLSNRKLISWLVIWFVKTSHIPLLNQLPVQLPNTNLVTKYRFSYQMPFNDHFPSITLLLQRTLHLRRPPHPASVTTEQSATSRPCPSSKGSASQCTSGLFPTVTSEWPGISIWSPQHNSTGSRSCATWDTKSLIQYHHWVTCHFKTISLSYY